MNSSKREKKEWYVVGCPKGTVGPFTRNTAEAYKASWAWKTMETGTCVNVSAMTPEMIRDAEKPSGIWQQ